MLKYYMFYGRITIRALGGVMMDILRAIVTIIYVIVCIALVVIVLMQEGKSAGLSGSINGVADSYWGKNKGRSMEGNLVKITAVLGALFVILAFLLNLKAF